MAAATVEPPLRPLATMAGTRRASSSSFASTTFTNPTGTPTTSAGAIFPASMSSARRRSAVGALPTATMSGPSMPQALSMLATARVVPAARAAAATSGSAMKHTAWQPIFASAGLLMPASAMFVSVSTVAPARSASSAQCAASWVNTRESAYEKSAVVWMTRFTTGSSSGGNVRPPSSSVMISKLRRSMSPGAISLESI